MSDTAHPTYSQISTGMARPSVPSKKDCAPVSAPAATATPGRLAAANTDDCEGVAGLRPYEFMVQGQSLRWYLKRDVDALLATRTPAADAGDLWRPYAALVAGGRTVVKNSAGHVIAEWDRELPAAELSSYMANPFQIFDRAAATSAGDVTDAQLLDFAETTMIDGSGEGGDSGWMVGWKSYDGGVKLRQCLADAMKARAAAKGADVQGGA